MRLLDGSTGAPSDEEAAAASGGTAGPEAPKEGSEAPSEGTDAGTTAAPVTTTAFSPLAFDQSYTWMMQLVVLVAAMTLFFPFLRNLFGVVSDSPQSNNLLKRSWRISNLVLEWEARV